MNEDVRGWLSEIRALKQQLAEAQTVREEAIAAETKWRQLYSTEAQQRRTEARFASEEIEKLKAQIQQLQTQGIRPLVDTPEAEAAIAKEVASLETVEALKAKLIETLKERDRALEALQAEQESHAQTRKSLTAVIADTIDQISKQKASS